MQEHHIKRHNNTVAFLKKHVKSNEKIIDLGTQNDLSKLISDSGFSVTNTSGENLDDNYHAYTTDEYDVLTAFEIFEHMLAPFNILKASKADKLVASIPLKLWFAEAYWDKENDWDKHYHEFEKKQFDFLLEQSGWVIKDSALWKSYEKIPLGIRPILRRFYPRYYIVYCERKEN
ncbi:MAG: methyltransferase [Crocinitomicaceae bacterium]|nr:methyltransferase [Flavobacteriales bacterium]NQZ36075.1 methyltransferase [Crocinitomicaceae bacterium]